MLDGIRLINPNNDRMEKDNLSCELDLLAKKNVETRAERLAIASGDLDHVIDGQTLQSLKISRPLVSGQNNNINHPGKTSTYPKPPCPS